VANGDNKKKTCFVVMGFGEKTDFYANPQRVLNLDRTFEAIIKPVLDDSGVECIRADTIIHSTVIDKPMYERLLEADLVIADLSTSNPNAIYELGVRHALRPYTTIVMAEQGFKFPFDVNHLNILQYEHLGKDIGFQETMRVRGELKKKISELIDKQEIDSPVFMFLPSLLAREAGAVSWTASTAPPQDDQSVADLMESLKQAKNDVQEPADWLVVVAVLNRLKRLQPKDPYLTQQLALATYKSEQPGILPSLHKAKSILEELVPDTSSDAETVGLWGAIHKRLWEQGQNVEDLDTAIRAYARGYFIKNDYYNGINFAFLLNVRAAGSQGDEAIADRVLAKRIRHEVLILCDQVLKDSSLNDDDRFWVRATQVEALFGLARQSEAEALKQQLLTQQPPAASWMMNSMNDQLAKLARLQP
jgi:hypothetical protein